MAFHTHVRRRINLVLEGVGLRLDTMTRERREQAWLNHLEESDYSERARFPLDYDNAAVKEIERYIECFSGQLGSGRACPHDRTNDYFAAPDAEVAYSMARGFNPTQVLEVGSGHSTCVFRNAVADGQLNCRIVSVDPQPRREVESVADRLIRRRVQEVGFGPFDSLQSGDFLFIDSSHEVGAGSDVVFLFLEVLPRLASGVIVHVHDVFLPYEYPLEWLRNGWKWNEQYLLYALLKSSAWDVIWPGFLLERTSREVNGFFSGLSNVGRMQSFWMKKR